VAINNGKYFSERQVSGHEADLRNYNGDPRGGVAGGLRPPRKEDVIVYKNKPSAFFGTMLEAWLRYDQVDTVIVIGLSTSRCVRATAIRS